MAAFVRARRKANKLSQRFAEYCGLPDAAAERAISSMTRVLPEALEALEASRLPEDMRVSYAALLRERSAHLMGG